MAVLVAIELALAAVALLAARGKWRRAALFLLVVTAPLEVYRSDLGPFNVSLFRLSLIPAAIAAASIAVRAWQGSPEERALLRRRVRAGAPIPLAYLLFAAVVGLSMLVNLPTSPLGPRELATSAVAVAAIVCVAVLTNHAGLRTVAEYVVAASVLPILASTWQAVAPRIDADPQLPLLSRLTVARGLDVNREAPVRLDSYTARTKGTFGDPNHYATFLLVVIACGIVLTLLARRERNGRRTTTFALCTAAALFSLISSYSRSAWLGFVVAAIAFVALGVRTRQLGRMPDRRRLAIGGVLLLLVAAPAIPNVVKRLEPNTTVNKGSNTVHLDTANAALDAFSHNPLLGVGPGWLGPSVDPPEDPRTSVAHCTYLTIASEEGIVGLLALLLAAGLTLAAFFRGARDPDRDRALLAIAFGSAYAGFVVANITYDMWFDDVHWISVGVATALASAAAPMLSARRLRLRDRRPAPA